MTSLRIFACKMDYDHKLSYIFFYLSDYKMTWRILLINLDLFLQSRFLVLKRYQDRDVASSFTIPLFLVRPTYSPHPISGLFIPFQFSVAFLIENSHKWLVFMWDATLGLNELNPFFPKLSYTISAESKFFFTCLCNTSKILINRSVFKTQSNISDGAFFCKNKKPLTVFVKKTHHRCSTGF